MLQVHDEKIPLNADQNGTIHVAGSRVTLDCVIGMFEAGASAEEIADEYDSLTLDQVYGIIFYYLRHEDEVKIHLAEQESESESAREKLNVRFPNNLREKLFRAKGKRG